MWTIAEPVGICRHVKGIVVWISDMDKNFEEKNIILILVNAQDWVKCWADKFGFIWQRNQHLTTFMVCFLLLDPSLYFKKMI